MNIFILQCFDVDFRSITCIQIDIIIIILINVHEKREAK